MIGAILSHCTRACSRITLPGYEKTKSQGLEVKELALPQELAEENRRLILQSSRPADLGSSSEKNVTAVALAIDSPTADTSPSPLL